jgi:hypothetical protein
MSDIKYHFIGLLALSSLALSGCEQMMVEQTDSEQATRTGANGTSNVRQTELYRDDRDGGGPGGSGGGSGGGGGSDGGGSGGGGSSAGSDSGAGDSGGGFDGGGFDGGGGGGWSG